MKTRTAHGILFQWEYDIYVGEMKGGAKVYVWKDGMAGWVGEWSYGDTDIVYARSKTFRGVVGKIITRMKRTRRSLVIALDGR